MVNEGIDRDGFIRGIPTGPFQVEFVALLDAVRQRLPTGMGENLVALYVYGSVAEGNARPAYSDLDLAVIVSDTTSETSTLLETLRMGLQRDYPIVSKIDFDVGQHDEVLAPGNHFSWGYWLRHHCRWLWGEPLAERFQRFRPSPLIARAVNGDVSSVLEGYIRGIEATPEPNELCRLQREASRKWLRGTHILRRDDESGWPWTLEDHAARTSLQHPELQALLTYFLMQSHTPTAARAPFLEALRNGKALLSELVSLAPNPDQPGD